MYIYAIYTRPLSVQAQQDYIGGWKEGHHADIEEGGEWS
jgi:hypothetical protein